jgi:hypothetical protein
LSLSAYHIAILDVSLKRTVTVIIYEQITVIEGQHVMNQISRNLVIQQRMGDIIFMVWSISGGRIGSNKFK